MASVSRDTVTARSKFDAGHKDLDFPNSDGFHVRKFQTTISW